MGWREWLWSLLPDKCEVRHMHTFWPCSREGVRGNENRMKWPDGITRVMCDNCTSHFLHLKLESR